MEKGRGVAVSIVGLAELRAAVEKNPQLVVSETRKFIQRGLAVYKKGIIARPWQLGSRGGGAPVDTGNLRDQHVTSVSAFEGRIYPHPTRVPYARFVHDGTKRMAARPWLDYVKQSSDPQITSLYRNLLRTISQSLAK